MQLQAFRAIDLACADAVHEQCVGDQRAVIAPRHCFGTHQRNTVGSCEFNDARQVRSEIRRLHAFGIATKRKVAPAAVGRVSLRQPKAAKADGVRIPDVYGGQRDPQRILVELRVVARHRAHVDQLRNAMAGEQFDERLDRPGRVADRQYVSEFRSCLATLQTK